MPDSRIPQSELSLKPLFTPKQRQLISQFPEAIQPEIGTIIENGGFLRAEYVDNILQTLNVDLQSLMLLLLPLAREYAVTPISGFAVGAVVAGIPRSNTGFGNLFLGANFEFERLPASFAMHAEQSAVNNAWLNSEVGITHLTVSDSPCGCCRQFLYELVTQPSVTVSLPARGKVGRTTELLEELLPYAFGPQDLLFRPGGLMEHRSSLPKFTLLENRPDPLVLIALSAASSSYAPYTGGFAGCAIQAADDSVYNGRYAETAAYSPGLMPLESAICNMTLQRGLDASQLKRAVLVETPSKARKEDIMRLVLDSFAPAVTLEVYAAAPLEEP